MKPSRRASTRRRRKSHSASPQVGTPATPATPFSPVPRDAPRPPCPSNFDPDVWERVVDIAVAASAKDSASGGQNATPGWATNAATVARETRERNDVGHPETDASDATPAILRATSDAHEKKHTESLLVAARAAVAAAADSADSETKNVDPAPLVRFALLREDLSVRESAIDGSLRPRAVARGVTFGAESSATERSEDVLNEKNAFAFLTPQDFFLNPRGVSSPPSAPRLSERDAALRALASVRNEHDAEVARLCASHENYEAFTAAVAQLGGARELLRRLATQARAQHDELVAAGAPVLEAEAGAERERAVAARLARAARRAHACHTACAVAHEAKVALDRRRWYDALRRIDALVAEHVPRLAPAKPPRSRFALSENPEPRTNEKQRDERTSASAFEDDEEDDDDDGGSRTSVGSKTSRALAAALLEDCARARDAALRGADADATQWLVAARAAAAAAGARALAVVDRRDETSARALASDASEDALVRASVERARARGAAAAAAARRAAVDVLAAAEGAKAARRAAESVGGEGTRPDELVRLASDASASFLSRASEPTTNLQRRIDFTAEAAENTDRDGGDARRNAVSIDASFEKDPSDPFFVFDVAASVEAPATAPLRAALRAFAAVGLGARFAARVREQRALQLRAEMRYDAFSNSNGFARESGGADDALRRLINESLAKFVGHFIVDARVALDLADVRPDVSDARDTSDAERAETFASALGELETHVVAAVADAEQAAVCRAAVAAVERACFALVRLGPGFESAPRLRDAAARAAKTRVVALLSADTADACASGDDARRLLSKKSDPASPDPTRSAFAADLASSAEAFAAETGAFLGGLVRGDARGSDAEARDAAATARRATRRCVERMAETCALPLFFSSETSEDAERTTLRTGAAFANGAAPGGEGEGDEASAARLIADAAWLDARVDGWCALAAEAATRAFRAADASTRRDDATLSASEVEAFASDQASSAPSPFGATAHACERALLRMVRAHVASATAATTPPGEWAPARPPTGPSERASAVAAYFYGTLRRALETPAPPAAAATFARVARASLSLCADATLQTMEDDALTKAVNAHGLLGLRHDLEAFEHVARTLAETALSTTEGELGEVGDALVGSLGSMRALLFLCADPGTTEGGSLEAFAADALAAAAGAADGDESSGDAEETPFSKPLTRARVARILEKYRDVPAGKGTDPSATRAFASKKRVDAVVKALKAR